MGFGTLLTSIAVGLVAGRLAASLEKDGAFSLAWDVTLGLAGSMVATAIGWIFMSAGPGLLATGTLATVGAAVALTVQRKFWPGPPPARVRARVRR